MAPTTFFPGSDPLSYTSYEDDKPSIVSNEPKDDSHSSCHDEQSIPDYVQVDFSKHGLAVTQQGLVYWKEGEMQHPRDWHIHRKLYDSSLVILFEFVA